jgi:hypothetical protein
MPRYFSEKRIAELYHGYDEVERKFRELQDRICLRTYKTNRGAEFAKHGLLRRLDTMIRAIDQVYELLPPEQEEIPSNDKVVQASMAVQAFVMNAFGCLDNIAWILVHEKTIKGKGGAELLPAEVGLGKKFVQKKLSKGFSALLKKHQTWFANLVSFRDSLAHRIPLYIPPHTVPKPNIKRYNELEKAKWEEPAKSDPEEYERVKAEQLKLCQFVPGMMHSIFEDSPQVEFHSQLLNDFVTIDEYARGLLDELDHV